MTFKDMFELAELKSQLHRLGVTMVVTSINGGRFHSETLVIEWNGEDTSILWHEATHACQRLVDKHKGIDLGYGQVLGFKPTFAAKVCWEHTKEYYYKDPDFGRWDSVLEIEARVPQYGDCREELINILKSM